MIDKVKKTIQKFNLIAENDKVLVGVSGGPDSVTLLNILHELGYNLVVAHINHGIRETALNDENYVIEFCEKLDIPCFIKRVKLKELDNHGMTLEELGRKIRYDFFYEIMKENACNKLATAHNANDNAETVMMNIFRGTGISGLKGIGPKRNNIVRPLIEVTRREIEEYCDENKLNPCHDETNDEAIYTRNKVRLELFPYVEKNINSNIIGTINRMAELVSEDEEYLQKETIKYYNECVIKQEQCKIICDLKIFNGFDVVIRKRLIILFIKKVLGNAKDIGKIHIEDILKLCEKNIGGKYLMPNKNVKILVLRGKIEITKQN